MMKIKLIPIFMLIIALLFGAVPVCAAGESYITGLTVTDDEDLTGYHTLKPGVNLRNAGEPAEQSTALYIAYEQGKEDDAVTDLVVSEEYSAAGITVNGIDYLPVSDISLNENTEGITAYLYYTKDRAAGEAIRTLKLSCYRTDIPDAAYDGDAILNDGYIPVLTDAGTAANLEEGREGIFIYLEMLPKTIYRPYIKSVHTVSAQSRKEAIAVLASLGCDYFIDENQSTAPVYTYIGYQRTADAKKAVTSLRAVKAEKLGETNSFTDLGKVFTVPEKVNIGSEETLYLAVSRDGDTPVYGFNIYGFGGGEDMTEEEFAAFEFGSRISVGAYLDFDPAYRAAMESEEPLGVYYVPVVAGSHIGLSMVYAGGEAFTEEQLGEEEEEENGEKDSETGEKNTETEEIVYDTIPGGTPEKEYEPNPEIDPDATTETGKTGEAQETASVLNSSPKVSAVLITAGLGLTVIIIVCCVRRKRNKEGR